ncbi:hypothetical protein [Streptomyces sp. A1547]|uniref:hypothetical protein n=1 Tax=Streptomyces sp. A1547 TaxID=2563105 RepID=UPI00109E5DF8|nr:hypothetical protein [Streptomyces sp. A1547]THA30543.1 hypothetical protein E6W17_37560 [Streptomyces sp. A1547]
MANCLPKEAKSVPHNAPTSVLLKRAPEAKLAGSSKTELALDPDVTRAEAERTAFHRIGEVSLQ